LPISRQLSRLFRWRHRLFGLLIIMVSSGFPRARAHRSPQSFQLQSPVANFLAIASSPNPNPKPNPTRLGPSAKRNPPALLSSHSRHRFHFHFHFPPVHLKSGSKRVTQWASLAAHCRLLLISSRTTWSTSRTVDHRLRTVVSRSAASLCQLHHNNNTQTSVHSGCWLLATARASRSAANPKLCGPKQVHQLWRALCTVHCALRALGCALWAA